MNTCGRDLTCADMIGNFILMPLERDRQERLYADHLRPIERGFERHGEEHFDVFIRDFLTLRTGEVPKKGEEYAAFKTHARSRRVEDAGPEALSADLRSCADHYRAMVLGEEADAALAQAFAELARLDMKPVWPFLLHLYGDYAGKRLSRHDLLTLTRLVTAYVMRRAVCSHRPAAPPPVFAAASRSVDPERYVESVRAYFLCLPDGSAFPSDEAFRAELASRNMYRFRHCDALLERLENDGRKERVPLSSFTVDHIMPQGERLPDAWQAELGPDWAQTWQEPPPHPRQPDPHRLQPGDGQQLVPRQALCRERVPRQPVAVERRSAADGLLGRRCHPRPRRASRRRGGRDLEASGPPRPCPRTVQDPARRRRPLHDRASPASASRRADARPLRGGQARRSSGLAPEVREEFTRHYVAYKTHTNFTDVVPQKRRLLLTLNVRFDDISDPRGLAADVTNLGLWGNGDVQVEVDNARQVPYAMELVRQALAAKQPGGARGSEG